MSDRISIWLAGLIVIALLVDILLGTGGILFLARRFLDLVEWLAFWR